MTGCDHALVSSHIKRGPDQAARHEDLAPISFVHSDFAAGYDDMHQAGVPRRRWQRLRGPCSSATGDGGHVQRARRMVIVQVWRNIGPAKMDLPLGVVRRRASVSSGRRAAVPRGDYAGSGSDFEALAIVVAPRSTRRTVVHVPRAAAGRDGRVPDVRQRCRACRRRRTSRRTRRSGTPEVALGGRPVRASGSAPTACSSDHHLSPGSRAVSHRGRLLHSVGRTSRRAGGQLPLGHQERGDQTDDRRSRCTRDRSARRPRRAPRRQHPRRADEERGDVGRFTNQARCVVGADAEALRNLVAHRRVEDRPERGEPDRPTQRAEEHDRGGHDAEVAELTGVLAGDRRRREHRAARRSP